MLNITNEYHLQHIQMQSLNTKNLNINSIENTKNNINFTQKKHHAARLTRTI